MDYVTSFNHLMCFITKRADHKLFWMPKLFQNSRTGLFRWSNPKHEHKNYRWNTQAAIYYLST